METCKWCGAWALFHCLSNNGLCKECNVLVVNRVQIHARRLMELMQTITTADDLEEKLQLCEDIVDETELLCEFEKLNISTVQPDPHDLLDAVSEHYSQLSELNNATESDISAVADGPALKGSIELAESMDPLGSWQKRVTV